MKESELYRIAEAVVLRDAMSDYIVKTAKTVTDHSNPDYLNAMAFLSHVFKKYQRIASTKVMTDEMGRITVRRDLRTDFDLN